MKFERMLRRAVERPVSEFCVAALSSLFRERVAVKTLLTLVRLYHSIADKIYSTRSGAGTWIPSRILNEHFLKVTYVNPARIQYVLKDGEVPFIQGGNWDQKIRPFEIHDSITEIYEKGIPYRQSSQYKRMVEKINLGERAYWCSTLEDVDTYFEILISACDEIKTGLYRVQGVRNGLLYPDEILVSVGRDGTLFHERNGTHRLSAAKFFGLSEVPVVVIRWHEKIYYYGCEL